MKKSLRFVVLLVALFVVGALVNTWSYLGEAHVDRKPLKDFPSQVGTWNQAGNDQVLDNETLKVLRATDYLLRDFRRADGKIANFYVGYYGTQRDGASFHSPLNCLPGSGWTLSEPGKMTVTTADGNSFVANRYVIQNGNTKSLMVYWYQGRGRAVASEYWGKIYTVLDSVRLRRSDGAMVRVTVPVAGSEQEALAVAGELAAGVTAALPEFVPN
jgi:EpsI family protein